LAIRPKAEDKGYQIPSQDSHQNGRTPQDSQTRSSSPSIKQVVVGLFGVEWLQPEEKRQLIARLFLLPGKDKSSHTQPKPNERASEGDLKK
jgi:hypothetical protein